MFSVQSHSQARVSIEVKSQNLLGKPSTVLGDASLPRKERGKGSKTPSQSPSRTPSNPEKQSHFYKSQWNYSMKPYETLEMLEKTQGQQKSLAGSRFGRMAYTVPPRGGTPRLEIRLERRGFGHLIPSPKMKISGKVCGKSPQKQWIYPAIKWCFPMIYIWLVVTGTWLDYDFPFSWECHHPN